jgi:hypothetical protein
MASHHRIANECEYAELLIEIKGLGIVTVATIL